MNLVSVVLRLIYERGMIRLLGQIMSHGWPDFFKVPLLALCKQWLRQLLSSQDYLLWGLAPLILIL